MIEGFPRHRPLGPRRQSQLNGATTGINKPHPVQCRMGQSADSLRSAQRFQDGPKGWVEAVPADLVPRESSTLDQSHAQTRLGRRQRRSRASRTGSGNSEVKGAGHYPILRPAGGSLFLLRIFIIFPFPARGIRYHRILHPPRTN